MKIEDPQLVKRIFEAALMAAERPLQRKDLRALFDDLEAPADELIDEVINALGEECEDRGYELKRVASGYRYQVKQDLSRWVSKLWQERAPRYSRALLETLSLIAYRQPITRGEIEEIRGVAVSSQIVKTLLEREWIKTVGHRDAPGRPAIYATTKGFLDYFNLKSLDQLPPLAEIRDLNTISRELNIELPEELLATESGVVAEEASANNASANDASGNVAAEITDTDTDTDSADVDDSVQDQGITEQGDTGPDDAVEEIAAFESWIDDELIDDEEPVRSVSDESVSELQASSGRASDSDISL